MISAQFLAPLLPATLLAGNTFTVDDDGPADFTSLVEAVQSSAVTDGDVLLVSPGSYAGFILTKALTICGPAAGPRPTLTSGVLVSASRVELVGLEVPGLQLQFVPGAATVDDCVVAGTKSQTIGLLANKSAQVTVSRSSVSGLSPNGGAGGLGVLAVGSRVVLAGSVVNGGAGGAGPYDGGDAVRANQCELLFAGGSLIGGAAGATGGTAGHGLNLIGSVARVRGSMFDAVLPGPPGAAGSKGESFFLEDGSTLVLGPILSSGTAQSGAPSSVVQPPVPEPFLRNVGTNGLGSAGSFDVFGPSGALALLVIGEGEQVTPVFELDGDLWVDPHSLLFAGFLFTNGTMFPAPCPYSIPVAPILVGRSFRSQALFPTVPGGLDPSKLSATNPVDVVVRS